MPHPYKWSPNPYVGDAQLREFYSWVQNEEGIATELHKYKDEELSSHLWIRAETARPEEILINHTTLTSDIELVPILE